jgi:acetate kinase
MGVRGRPPEGAGDGAIISINAGSSSLKAALFELRSGELHPVAHAAVSRIGGPLQRGRVVVADAGRSEPLIPRGPDHSDAVTAVLDRFSALAPQEAIRGIGHRVVHAQDLSDHALVTTAVEDAIADGLSLAPLHNPAALAGIRAARQSFGALVPMVAVLDTAFFATLPPKARHYAIPWDLAQRHGIRRLGFHGIAHQSMVATAGRVLGKPVSDQVLVTLQLGNGCSATLVRNGVAVDTTMGMTPLEGLMMGTRSGSLDPALVVLIADREGIDATAVTAMLNEASGLLGVSGVASDMRDVMAAAASGNDRAELAVDMFVDRVRKQVGAFAAADGPIDAVVFGGGIGEGSPAIRAAICRDLGHLGISLDEEANRSHGGGDADISGPGASVRTVVARVDELTTIAEVTRSHVS